MDWAEQDRKQRERLERNSSAGQRADIVNRLNRVSEGDVVIQRSAGTVLTKLRNAAQGRRRTIGEMNARHDAYLAKSASFNRLHPFRRAAAERLDIEDQDDARDQRFTPDLRDRTVIRDADGSMDADAQTRASHFEGQGGRDLGLGQMAETLRLTAEQMRALAVAQVVASRYF